MKLSDFRKGNRVRYVPNHASGDTTHKDCQDGVVKRVSDQWVFVIYDNAEGTMFTGDEPFTAAATDPENLVRWGKDYV